MQLDVTTTLVISGAITAGIGLTTLFYSLTRKENRPLFWATAASAGYSAGMVLAALRDQISDFWSIIVVNEIMLFFPAAYYETFCRLFSVSPRERIVGPILLVIQPAVMVYFTYFHPHFQARVVGISISLSIMCLCNLKVLATNIQNSHRSILIFAGLPFLSFLLMSLVNITLFFLGQGIYALSFKSPEYSITISVYCVSSVWITMSMLFVVSDRLQSQVVKLSMTDPLTGVPNRRALQQAADREVARSHRNGSPLSLIITDVDRFKMVNDHYGHQAGDALLSHLVAIYQESLRAGDVLARYGGDEFVVVLPGADLDGAITGAERMRAACESQVLRFRKQSIPVTASFGVAVCDAGTSNYERLVKHADDALYQAKQEGGNRVVVFQQC